MAQSDSGRAKARDRVIALAIVVGALVLLAALIGLGSLRPSVPSTSPTAEPMATSSEPRVLTPQEAYQACHGEATRGLLDAGADRERVQDVQIAFAEIARRTITVESDAQRFSVSVSDATDFYVLEPFIKCMLEELGAKATPRVELMEGIEGERSVDWGTYQGFSRPQGDGVYIEVWPGEEHPLNQQ